MNTRVSNALRAFSLTALAGAMLFSASSAFAAPCLPELRQRSEQNRQEKLREEAERAERVWKGHMEQPDWLKDSDGLLTACMSNNWPKITVSQPALQKLLSGAQERATKEACNRARDAISKQSGRYQDMLGSIPGYESLRSSTNNFGSWPEIGDLVGNNIPTGSNTGLPNWGDLDLPGFTTPGGGGTNVGTNPGSNNGGSSLPGLTP